MKESVALERKGVRRPLWPHGSNSAAQGLGARLRDRTAASAARSGSRHRDQDKGCMVRDACPTYAGGSRPCSHHAFIRRSVRARYPGYAPRGTASRRMNAKQFSCMGRARSAGHHCPVLHDNSCSLLTSTSDSSSARDLRQHLLHALSRAKGFDLACVADRATSRNGRTIDDDARNYTRNS